MQLATSMYEQHLHEIWADVLQRHDLTSDTNFVVAGGDSLKAMEIARRVETHLGMRIAAIDVLKHPTIRAFDNLLQQSSATQSLHIPPAPARTKHHTAPVQRALFLLDQLTDHTATVAYPLVVHLDDGLDPSASRNAFRLVVARHEILRTTFCVESDEVCQIVHDDPDETVEFSYSDVAGDEDPASSLQRIYDEVSAMRLDVHSGPLARCHIVKLAPTECLALFTMHHIVSDEISFAELENDFRFFSAGDGYTASKVDNREHHRSTRRFQYKDYASWLEQWVASAQGMRCLNFWKAELSGYQKPAFLFSAEERLTPPLVPARRDFQLGLVELKQLEDLSHSAEATLFVILQSCIASWFYLETGNSDVVIGAPFTVRDLVGATGEIGPYFNTLPIRTRLALASSFYDVVASVRESTLRASQNKLLPVETIADVLGHEHGLYDIGFVLRSERSSVSTARRVTYSPKPTTRSNGLGVKLWIVAVEHQAGISIQVHYQRRCFTDEFVVALTNRLRAVVGVASAMPHSTLREMGNQVRPEAVFESIDLDLS